MDGRGLRTRALKQGFFFHIDLIHSNGFLKKKKIAAFFPIEAPSIYRGCQAPCLTRLFYGDLEGNILGRHILYTRMVNY